MNHFYRYEERRIEKISPVIEIPPEIKRKLVRQENVRRKREWHRKIQKMRLMQRILKKTK